MTFCRHSPSSDTAGSPTVPLDTTTSYKQATADPYDAYDDPDAPISRRTRFVRFTRPHLFDKPAPLQQPIRPRPRLINNLASLQQPTLPNKPTSVRSEKAAPKRSPNLDMEFLTGRIIALTERNASLEHENEALKTLNQELKTKYEVLAEKVAGLADILRREA